MTRPIRSEHRECILKRLGFSTGLENVLVFAAGCNTSDVLRCVVVVFGEPVDTVWNNVPEHQSSKLLSCLFNAQLPVDQIVAGRSS